MHDFQYNLSQHNNSMHANSESNLSSNLPAQPKSDTTKTHHACYVSTSSRLAAKRTIKSCGPTTYLHIWIWVNLPHISAMSIRWIARSQPHMHLKTPQMIPIIQQYLYIAQVSFALRLFGLILDNAVFRCGDLNDSIVLIVLKNILIIVVQIFIHWNVKL